VRRFIAAFADQAASAQGGLPPGCPQIVGKQGIVHLNAARRPIAKAAMNRRTPNALHALTMRFLQKL
jgi:hypothetical protein